MSLQPGARLGPYEILELAGAGGMGEVYKARDTRLDRTVALKILPANAYGVTDLKQRFEREAQAIANLKHPNICVLHDVGYEAGTDFIVMEYLQGETLADRLVRGKRGSGTGAASRPLSDSASVAGKPPGASKTEAPGVGRALKLDDALSIAMQIAEALDQAHRQGIVHRDLKPANVMLLPSSGGSSAAHVKLLDFGLAKLTAAADPIENANTVQADLTGPGVVLGTVRYMAPEQVEGLPVDARTDIFAFGAVLYEMLTGRRAFEGKTSSSLIAAIMNVDPTPLSALMPIAPRALERLVMRCLAKDPNDRWQHAHDVLIQLRWIAGRGAKSGASSAVTPRGRRDRWMLATLAASVLIIAGMAAPAWRYVRGAAPPDDFRFRVPTVGLSPQDIAISPNGKLLALVAKPGQEASAIYVRPVNEVKFRRLAGTDNAQQPFWSPDSSTIGFGAGGRLKKVAASGATPLDIGAIDKTFFGGSWGADNTILYGSTAGIRRVSAEGGAAELITTVEKPEAGHYWPAFLPDGKHFLYLAWSGQVDQRAILAGAVGSKDRTRVMAADSNAQYAPGYLLFEREGTLLAQPFDATALTLSSGPVQIAGEVGFNLGNGHAYFNVSQAGNLVYFQGSTSIAGRANVLTNWQSAFHDRTGKELGKPIESGAFGEMDLSPDEKRIAITRQDPGTPGSDVWVIDLERAVSAKLTLEPSDDMNPVWAPDGNRIAFVTFRKGNADVYVKNANGVGAETPLLASPADEYIEDWSKDGRNIVFKLADGEFEDLYVLPIGADGKPGTPFPVVQGPYHKDEAQFSYDGQWLAYGSDESGRWEIYVTSFPKLDQKLKVTNAGGGRPRWRRDSKEILFIDPRSPVMAVDFRPGPRIDAGIPHEMFNKNATAGADPTRHLWDVSADGQRIFMRTSASIAGGTRGAIPTLVGNFVTGPALTPGTAQAANPNPSQPQANGLTIVENWAAAFRKTVK